MWRRASETRSAVVCRLDLHREFIATINILGAKPLMVQGKSVK
jgi:hypothetical protein